MSDSPVINIQDEIQKTLESIQYGDTEKKISSTKHLGDLLRKPENRPVVMESGGLKILLPLLFEDVEFALSCQLVRAISNLIFDSPDNIKEIVQHEKIYERISSFIKQEKSLELKRNTIAAVANFAHESGISYLLIFR